MFHQGPIQGKKAFFALILYMVELGFSKFWMDFAGYREE